MTAFHSSLRIFTRSKLSTVTVTKFSEEESHNSSWTISLIVFTVSVTYDNRHLVNDILQGMNQSVRNLTMVKFKCGPNWEFAWSVSNFCTIILVIISYFILRTLPPYSSQTFKVSFKKVTGDNMLYD